MSLIALIAIKVTWALKAALMYEHVTQFTLSKWLCIFYFQRLRQSGAFITTSECILFSLLGSAKHPNFKEVQALVKTSAPDSGLLSKV